ncbi:Glutathione import ATP-binding protein GsiA [Providencia rettgeri]|uniref:Glutathione import ATP-binding protein GsiA n=1 Tax=Providencia rettgeri TaxID=587 RepID=A0A379FRF8_PRORE|nr:Glutathione import ATP-binding protein GsiA [Providencia rettgeri]
MVATDPSRFLSHYVIFVLTSSVTGCVTRSTRKIARGNNMSNNPMKSPLLSVKDLSVTFATQDGDVTAVNKLNFELSAGETLGIVGESGSGKSQTAFALMGLLAKNGKINGSAIFNGREILNLREKELNRMRAEEISMIFQDPMTSLNPYLKIGHTTVRSSHVT